jgi:hypothetical protein
VALKITYNQSGELVFRNAGSFIGNGIVLICMAMFWFFLIGLFLLIFALEAQLQDNHAVEAENNFPWGGMLFFLWLIAVPSGMFVTGIYTVVVSKRAAIVFERTRLVLCHVVGILNKRKTVEYASIQSIDTVENEIVIRLKDGSKVTIWDAFLRKGEDRFLNEVGRIINTAGCEAS